MSRTVRCDDCWHLQIERAYCEHGDCTVFFCSYNLPYIRGIQPDEYKRDCPSWCPIVTRLMKEHGEQK